jgi:hypothetical protein
MGASYIDPTLKPVSRAFVQRLKSVDSPRRQRKQRIVFHRPGREFGKVDRR